MKTNEKWNVERLAGLLDQLHPYGRFVLLLSLLGDETARDTRWPARILQADEEFIKGYVLQLSEASVPIEVMEGRLELPISLEDEARILAWETYAGILLELERGQATLHALFNCAMEHQQAGDKAGEAADLGNMGSIFLAAGQLDKAESSFEQALKLHTETEDKLGQAIDRANLGVISAERGNYHKAADNLKHALVIFEQLGDESIIQQTRENLERLGDMLQSQD